MLSSSSKHNCLTHFPKDPDCPICNAGRPQRPPKRAAPMPHADDLPPPQAFGDSITGDHKILNKDDTSRDHDRVALIIFDRFTRWLQAYPSSTKSAKEVRYAFRQFLGPYLKAKYVYTDNAAEFKKALEELEYPHDTSIPHRSETNSIIERQVRKVNEGTSCALIQSGLDSCW